MFVSFFLFFCVCVSCFRPPCASQLEQTDPASVEFKQSKVTVTFANNETLTYLYSGISSYGVIDALFCLQFKYVYMQNGQKQAVDVFLKSLHYKDLQQTLGQVLAKYAEDLRNGIAPMESPRSERSAAAASDAGSTSASASAPQPAVATTEAAEKESADDKEKEEKKKEKEKDAAATSGTGNGARDAKEEEANVSRSGSGGTEGLSKTGSRELKEPRSLVKVRR